VEAWPGASTASRPDPAEAGIHDTCLQDLGGKRGRLMARIDSEVLAEALESLHFGKGKPGCLWEARAAPPVPVCLRDLAEGGLCLVTSCPSRTLGSGASGAGETGRSKAARTRTQGPFAICDCG